MQILEYTFIGLGLVVGVGSLVATGHILYKMKTSKDGFWRP